MPEQYIELTCSVCGKRFSRAARVVRYAEKMGSPIHLCSRRCQGLKRSGLRFDPPITLTCECCGQEFERPAWDMRVRAKEGKPVRYCSSACRYAGRKQRTPRVTLTCSTCGKTFTRAAAYIRNRAALGHPVQFCSHTCRHGATHSWVTPANHRTGQRHDLGFRLKSSWEANVCRVLKALGFTVEYEPQTFRMGDEFYTPDFLVNGSFWIEVKGWMKPESRRKIAAFRRSFPAERLVVIDGALYKSLAREWSDRIPEWEFPQRKRAA